VRRDASQGEMRSHGFFYRPGHHDGGLLGLPILAVEDVDPDKVEVSASMLFLANEGLRLRALGELRPLAGAGAEDGCRASCFDWYGNARPLFLGDRILALLGYELVEGTNEGGRIVERRRVSFAPASAPAPR
jgi:hypothetical protein